MGIYVTQRRWETDSFRQITVVVAVFPKIADLNTNPTSNFLLPLTNIHLLCEIHKKLEL